MLRPIPRGLLTDHMVLKACIGMDSWQNPKDEVYNVSHVHLQSANEVRKTKDNTEVVLRSVLFIDGTISQPVLDYDRLLEKSLKSGKPLRAEIYNFSGQKCGDFEVLTVDSISGFPAEKVHHIELGLV